MIRSICKHVQNPIFKNLINVSVRLDFTEEFVGENNYLNFKHDGMKLNNAFGTMCLPGSIFLGSVI